MTKKKSIAFVISSLNSGGAERVVSTLSNELTKKYKVTIVTFIGGQPFYNLDNRIKVLPTTDEIAPSQNIFRALKTNFGLYKKISVILKNEKIDLVIGFMTSPNVLAILAAKANKIPVIISERINPFLSNTSFVWNQLRKFSYPKANYLVVQTEEIKSFFKGKLLPCQLLILANPISAELTANRNSLQQKENVVLNVGRHTGQKAQHMLIRAFAAIRPEGWELHIIGRGPLKNTLQNLISELHMENKIYLLPPTHEIEKHYNEASIFAFTSIFEGFPNALTEAMHFGLPCIATDCPTGPSELIENDENGFLIPVNDKKILQLKLQILISDKILQKRFGEKARESVVKYEAENVSKTWEDLIEKALIQGGL